MSNPIKIIKDDHRMIEKLFKEYAQLGDDDYEARQDLAEQICTFLISHREMEEQILYPKLTMKFDKEGEITVEEALAGHETAKNLIKAIENLEADNPQFDLTVMTLHEIISQHIKEGEQLHSKTEKELTEDELEEIGDEMIFFKSRDDKE